MFSTALRREEMAMTDARPQLICAPIISRTAGMIVAGLLIFIGLVFQLGQFICDHVSATGYWLIHVIAANLWSALVLRLNALGLGPVLHLWPLLLVGFGLAILLALQPTRSNSR